MPSELLTALYHRRADEAAAIAARLPELDIFEVSAMGDAIRLREIIAQDRSRATAWSDDGFTPLHLAAFFGHPQSMRILIEAGGDINAAARGAMTVRPLHSAVTARSLPCVELLLAAGADPNGRQSGGFTPLHSAVRNGDAAIEAALLAAGADASARTDDGRGIAEFRGG